MPFYSGFNADTNNRTYLLTILGNTESSVHNTTYWTSTSQMGMQPADICANENGDISDIIAENLVRERQEYSTIEIVDTIVLSILCVLGVIGNLLVIFIFTFKMNRGSSNYFVTVLAVIDFIISIVIIPGTILQDVWVYPFDSDAACKLWELTRTATVIISWFILVAIAFDRYFLICRSPHVPITKTATILIIATSAGLSIMLSIVTALSVGAYDNCNNFIGICVPDLRFISFDVSKNYLNLLIAICIFLILPIMAMYALIFMRVRRQRQKWWKKYRPPVDPQERLRVQQEANPEIADDPSSVSPTEEVNTTPELLRSKTRAQSNKASANKREPERLNNAKENGNDSLLGNSSTELVVKYIKNINEDPGTNNHGVNEGLSANSTENDLPSNTQDENGLGNKKLSVPSVSIQRSGSRGSPKRRVRKPEYKTAQIMFIVTIVYILSFLSWAIPTILATQNRDFNTSKKLRIVFHLIYINSMANPVIYSFMNVKFRNELTNLFSCK